MSQAQDEVVLLDFGVRPEAAISGANLMMDEMGRTYLAFNAMRLREDGRYEDAGFAIVNLKSGLLVKFGHPNDEARPGHPLYHHGLNRGGYGIYEVLNSSWIAEMMKINSVQFPDTKWPHLRHFIFSFHESTLECITEGIE